MSGQQMVTPLCVQQPKVSNNVNFLWWVSMCIRIRDLHVVYKFLLVLYATLYYCTYSYVGMHACAQDTGERISSSSKMHRRFLMLSWQTPLGRCGRREGELLICSWPPQASLQHDDLWKACNLSDIIVNMTPCDCLLVPIDTFTQVYLGHNWLTRSNVPTLNRTKWAGFSLLRADMCTRAECMKY